MSASSHNVAVEPHSNIHPGTFSSARAAAYGGSPEKGKRSSFPKAKGAGLAFIFTLLRFLALLAAGPSELLAVSVNPGTTYQFTNTDNCDCAGTPFLDTALKATQSSCDLDRSRAEAAAMLSVSAINLDVTAFDTLYTCFSVPGNQATVLNATVSADISWDGILFGAGVLGAGAAVEVDLSLVDDTDGTTKVSTQVMTKSQDSAGLKGIDVGGTHVVGSQTVSMRGTLVRGHQYSLRLKVTTSAQAGLVGLDVGSLFATDVFGLGLGDRYVRWNSLAITVEQDVNEKLDQLLQGQAELKQGQTELKQGQTDLKQGQADLKQGQADLKQGQVELKQGQAEIKNLLLAPQGQRPGFPHK